MNQYWKTIDKAIFEYLGKENIKDANNKAIQNYHGQCLKMLANIYQTESGLEFMKDTEASG